MSSVATGGTGATGKQGGVPFLDNSSDDDTGKPYKKNLIGMHEIHYDTHPDSTVTADYYSK
jgi:hypothetical protein